MKEISKEWGKILIRDHRDLVYPTSHKRHYYIVEDRTGMRLLDMLRNGTYTPTSTGRRK